MIGIPEFARIINFQDIDKFYPICRLIEARYVLLYLFTMLKTIKKVKNKTKYCSEQVNNFCTKSLLFANCDDIILGSLLLSIIIFHIANALYITSSLVVLVTLKVVLNDVPLDQF